MDQPSLPHRYLFGVDALHNRSRADQLMGLLRKGLEHAPGGQKVETDTQKRILIISSSVPLDIGLVKAALQPYGFHLRELKETEPACQVSSTEGCGTMDVCVEGMTCHSCELIIERAWKKLEAVHSVEVDAATGMANIAYTAKMPTVAQLQKALGEGKYVVSLNGTGRKTARPPFFQLIGLFALVLLLGKILSSLGLFKTGFTVGSGMGLGAIFVIGLVAAASSCIAVSGGLLLSSAAKFNERYSSAHPMGKMRPVVLFVLGRIAGYGLLGGVLGLVGKALTPSPIVTAIIAILAAVYMIVMGLDMLQVAPSWLKRLIPKMPKAISRRVMDAEGKEHPLMPMGLGAATFFLPCGFTQALQLYALTTGSFLTAGLSLAVFALGTAPALLALGWASSSLKGKAGQFFFRFSGALVVVLGLWNIQNGLTIAGYPLSFPSFSIPAPGLPGTPANAQDLAPVINGKQVVKMRASGGYKPNHFTIRAGTPVRWEIDASKGAGCASALVSRGLGIQTFLEPIPNNVIEFTPTITGEIPFSCSMGMYRGSFTILPPVSTI